MAAREWYKSPAVQKEAKHRPLQMKLKEFHIQRYIYTDTLFHFYNSYSLIVLLLVILYGQPNSFNKKSTGVGAGWGPKNGRVGGGGGAVIGGKGEELIQSSTQSSN